MGLAIIIDLMLGHKTLFVYSYDFEHKMLISRIFNSPYLLMYKSLLKAYHIFIVINMV
jgi:hypothetical protein